MDNINHDRFPNLKPNMPWVKVLPGGVYVTNQVEIICTGLGSCVAACMWDEKAQVGGMNHFLLPFDTSAQLHHWKPQELLSTASRYGCYAMELLINQLIIQGADRRRLKVKLFGGAQLMGFQSLIGIKNVEFVMAYVQREQLKVEAQDLGGTEPRRVLFDPRSGRVWIKRIPCAEVSNIRRHEERYFVQLDKETHTQTGAVELFE
ncbi:chemotaxis protein CheD [Vibrio fluvialis]|nr:chemotaxis protein CheD [Vibrio fluvialis]MCE7595688.1 chemotaxis protein CheD [Vibrio fluvialis]MCE7643607.1 chemotaxis protein CheD [Vibrio fluvialis]